MNEEKKAADLPPFRCPFCGKSDADVHDMVKELKRLGEALECAEHRYANAAAQRDAMKQERDEMRHFRNQAIGEVDVLRAKLACRKYGVE